MLHKVKCSSCGAIVGKDSQTKIIEKCSLCLAPKKKSKEIRTASSAFAKTKKGIAIDLPEPYNQVSFRSGWERNFARYLCAAEKEWEYERTVFTFKEDRKGNPFKRKPFIYIPDFKETRDGTLWEIKGYLRSEDRSKMKRFLAIYPEEFKKLRACVSRHNKKAIFFYEKMGVPLIFIEDLKAQWKDKIPTWE